MNSINQPILEHNLGIYRLAEELGCLSRVCKILGVSINTFCLYKQAKISGDIEAFFRNGKHSENLKNFVDAVTEEAILEFAFILPTYSNVRVSNQLRRYDIFVTPGKVMSIWKKHNIESFKQRMAAIEKGMAAAGIVLSEAQRTRLEEKNEDEIESGKFRITHPGYLGLQGNFYVGALIDVGWIYQQIFVDAYSGVAFAKLYTTKLPIAAADLLNDRVLPFFAGHKVGVQRILTDNVADYCGKLGSHEYQLFMAVNSIQHTTVKTASREISSACEQLHRKIQLELHEVALRKNVYQSIERLQGDLDSWLHRYNHVQPHPGDMCKGRTPMKTFLDGKKLAR